MKVFWYDNGGDIRHADVESTCLFAFLKDLSTNPPAESVFWVLNNMFVQYDLWYQEIITYKPVPQCTLDNVRKALASPAIPR
jgi:hypothetical protein